MMISNKKPMTFRVPALLEGWLREKTEAYGSSIQSELVRILVHAMKAEQAEMAAKETQQKVAA